MSLPIWPSDKLLLKEGGFFGKAWRIVEVGEFVDHRTEAYFHRLLCGPFRPCKYLRDSRFRRAGVTSGVWYGSETPKTAAIELAFHRSFDYAKPSMRFQSRASECIAFLVEVKTDAVLDLTEGAIARDEHLWKNPNDYGDCQQLAEELCKIEGEIIRYASVRDEGGFNIAVLSCCAFVGHEPLQFQEWKIQHDSSGVRIACEEEKIELTFPRNSSSGEVMWNKPKEK